MKSRARLTVEHLEDRWCPALTATLSGGVLTISGTADNGAININQTTAGTISVLDNSTAVSGSPFSSVTDIKLNLTTAGDTVNVDLGGQTLSGDIRANLGGGTDSLTVKHGTLGGDLSVNYGAAGEGRHHGWECDGGWGGRGNATVDTGLDTITLAADATVDRMSVRGGQAGSTISVAGHVTDDLNVDAYRSGTTAGTSLTVSGTVDESVWFDGSSAADTLNISGSVGRSVSAWLGAGGDTVGITGNIGRHLSLCTGSGDDQVTLSSTISRRSWISTGSGSDTVNLTATANLQGHSSIGTGADNDSVTLSDSATITTMHINGGSGTNTFTGTTGRTGLTLTNF